MQNMPDCLAEHQSIMLENFGAIYISTNGTVPFMSQSFIAGSAILCLFMPNDRSFNSFYTTSETFLPSTHVQSSYELFLYWNISVKASYT